MIKKSQGKIHLKDIYRDIALTIHFVGVLDGKDYFELPMHRNEGYEICVISSVIHLHSS